MDPGFKTMTRNEMIVCIGPMYRKTNEDKLLIKFILLNQEFNTSTISIIENITIHCFKHPVKATASRFVRESNTV